MQFSCEFFVCTFLALFSAFSSANALSHHRRPKHHETVDVDPTGKGHFRTIQAAINSVPSQNKHWICIRIKKGVYREQISIPNDKPFIYLKGEGKRNTYVVWDAHGSIATSATFSSYADNTIANGITFVNSYNSPPNRAHNPMMPALAAKIQGDKSAFYKCGFYGLQDTLWDVQGRHYFKLCTIQGAVDFIFGAGQSLYERCSISVVERGPHSVPGYITAQGRSKSQETNGFVFKDCNIDGKGKTYLGRPWRGYATVLFYNTTMSEIVVPRGWDAWYSVGHEKQLTFAEHGCRGKGSDSSRRVKWANKLSERKLEELRSISFIDNEGWMKKLAFNILSP
ncbi:Pectin lyase-like superfamily protein [Perilla frutescens var. frutescens]|nr:Pectin lyase-like superfamily protein [Perilla frutescens var. frutescens]